MKLKKISLLISISAIFLAAYSSEPSIESIELKKYPIDNLEGIITKSGVKIDYQISSDSRGSLRISVDKPTVVRLFETGDIDVESARLTYSAKVRTQDVDGSVYLEMWCCFLDEGEYFSRGLHNILSGTTDWKDVETYFYLKQGENPGNIKLNLVIQGKGTVWIDDIHLIKDPQNAQNLNPI